MMTVADLKQFGADTDDGLKRCMNNESFYLRLVKIAANDAGYNNLKNAIDNNDAKTAFEEAHKLKGVLGNLSLTPLYKPVCEITEITRAGSCEGCAEFADAVIAKRDELLSLL